MWFLRTNLDQKEGYAPGFAQQTRHVRCGSEERLSVKVRLVEKVGQFGHPRAWQPTANQTSRD